MAEPYVKRQPAGWWLKNPAYRRYMLREATALPLFAYTLLLITGVYRLSQGEEAFTQWLVMLRSPWCVTLHVVALAAALLHAWTWLQLVPKILVVHTNRLRVSGTLIKRVHQLGALLGSVGLVVLAWLFLAQGGS